MQRVHIAGRSPWEHLELHRIWAGIRRIAAPGSFWLGIAAIALYNGAFLAYLEAAPASSGKMLVDDLGSALGALVLGVIGLIRLRSRRRSREERQRGIWAPTLLVAAPLWWAASEAVVAYCHLAHGSLPSFPSAANVAYTGALICLVLGMWLLPRRPLSASTWLRVGLDTSMVFVAAATCSWYFVSGPVLLGGDHTFSAIGAEVAVPLTYLSLLVCVLLLLAARAGDMISSRTLASLAPGATVIVMADSVYDYQSFHHTYASGMPVDMLWSLGFMLIALGAVFLGQRRAPVRAMPSPEPADQSGAPVLLAAPLPPLWQSLLPYLLLPFVVALVLICASDPVDAVLQDGVNAGGATLIGLVIIRQILAMRELRETYAGVTLLGRANAHLAVMARTDVLTGLGNRTLLRERLERSLAAPVPSALLLLDLDRFKDINDTLGHYSGDLVLEQVGSRLCTVVRATDTVARLGGDEFAIVLRGTTEAGAVEKAKDVLRCLEAPFLVDDQLLSITGSIGVALDSPADDGAEALLRRADVAMYTAKRGRTGYALYDAEVDTASQERLALIADLREAIGADTLVVYFQPQVSLRSGEVHGVEALVRWPHPAHGLLLPDRFIPLAERSGLIVPLTYRVLEAAVRQAAHWQSRNVMIPVSVNISAASLSDLKLPGTVDALLRAYGVPASSLRIEVTESAMMTNLERTRAMLAQVAEQGIGISVDDYGTGYSSLAYLNRLPIDELKIDKAFVQHLLSDAADAVIVASTIGLAHNLGLRVVAEGVEDEATLQRLADLGCDVVQGYYFSRPVPIGDLESWLASRARTSWPLAG